MFESVFTLRDLNQERQRLVREGTPVPSVNSAYNAAKRRILENTSSYRTIPFFSHYVECATEPVPNTMGLHLNAVSHNVLQITADGILI